MGKKQNIRIEILRLLNELDLAERINIINSIGDRLRKQSSIENHKEVEAFTRKTGNKKNIDYSPILKNK